MKYDIKIINKSDENVIIYNYKTNNMYIIGLEEFKILQMFWSGKTISDIMKKYCGYSEVDLKKLYCFFREKKFLLQKDKLRINTCEFHENSVLKKFINIIRMELTYLSIPIFIIGIMLLIKRNFLVDTTKVFTWMIGSPVVAVVTITIILGVSLLVHEFAHAIIAVSDGAVVFKIGMGIKGIFLHGYTKLSWGKITPSKRQKIILYLAGILWHLQVAGISIILSVGINSKYRVYLLLIFLINIMLACGNSAIWSDTDGFRILIELLQEQEKEEIIKIKSKQLWEKGDYKFTVGKFIRFSYFLILLLSLFRGVI